jgi:undecaprenyl pyrophosphate phosphatase UppP
VRSPRRPRSRARPAQAESARRSSTDESSGAAVAGLASYVSVKWLTRYFETRTLIPFAIYWLVAGAICIGRFS